MPAANISAEDRSLQLKVVTALAVYFAVHAVLRALSGDALGNDEAEQVFISTGFRLGYYMAPPLYQWLQVAFFRTLGTNLWALGLLNNALFFFFYLFVFLSARIYFESARLAAVAALSLLLVPEIVWESQRDETHTVLAMAAAAATLYVLMRVLRERATWSYVALGIALGLGFLSKYNYVCFAAAAFAALLLKAESRRALFDPRIALTLAIGAAVALPHVFWWLAHRPPVLHASETGKLDPFHHHALFSLVANTFKLLAPMSLVVLWFSASSLPRRWRTAAHGRSFHIGAYLIAAVGVVAVLVIAVNISDIQQHWLVPLLFVAPLYFVGYVHPEEIGGRRWTAFLALVGSVLVFIPAGLVVYRTGLGASYFGVTHYPFGMLAKQLEERHLERGLLITDKLQMAGNLRYHFPGAAISVVGIDERALANVKPGETVTVVWQPARRPTPPPALDTFIRDRIDPALLDTPVEIVYNPAYGRAGYPAMGAGLLVLPELPPAVSNRLAARAAGGIR